MPEPRPVGPAAEQLVGLLAEPARLRAFAAVVLGAGTPSEVAASAGLDHRAATAALERLVAGGLLVRADDGRLGTGADRFKEAARAAAQRAEPGGDDFGRSVAAASVLRNFVSGGRLRSIPAAHGKRLVVLDWLCERFEPGRTYPERDVNLLLEIAHPDVAALRRYLVDDGFLERRDGFYWRAGGTVVVD